MLAWSAGDSRWVLRIFQPIFIKFCKHFSLFIFQRNVSSAHTRKRSSIEGSLCDREVACSASDSTRISNPVSTAIHSSRCINMIRSYENKSIYSMLYVRIWRPWTSDSDVWGRSPRGSKMFCVFFYNRGTAFWWSATPLSWIPSCSWCGWGRDSQSLPTTLWESARSLTRLVVAHNRFVCLFVWVS